MAGTKESARIKDVRALVEKHWPEYTVIGNKPYAKGCYIIKKGERPRVVDSYRSNGRALEAVTSPGYHPEQGERDVNGGWFPQLPATELDMLLLLNKGRDHFQEASEILPVFGITVSDRTKSIQERLQELRKHK